jgi:hypothetical protein
MGTEPFYLNRPEFKDNSYYKAALIAHDVKDYPVITDQARMTIP